MLKMGARVAAPMYTVINAESEFSEDGVPVDRATAEKRATALVNELMWLVERSAVE